MPIRMSLVCHARTRAQREGRFARDDEALEHDHEAALAMRVGELKAPRRVLCAPELRTRQTAAAWHGEAQVLDELRDCDYGAWRGHGLDELPPEALADWLSNPDSTAHGGESQAQLCARVGAWLDGFCEEGHSVVVTHPAVLRAALLHVIGAGAQGFNTIDVEPLAVLRLTFNGRWRVRL